MLRRNMEFAPVPGNKLLAWIEPCKANEFLASFVAFDTISQRPPATQRCTTSEAAKQWIEQQAAALGLPIQWEEHPRGRT